MNRFWIFTGFLLVLAACTAPVSEMDLLPTQTNTSTIPSRTPFPTRTPLPTWTPLPDVGSTWIRQVDGMVMVFVPNGPYDADDNGIVDAILPAFWIDQTEVTNAMYALCVNAGACKSPRSFSSSTREHYYDDPQYANYPVINVTYTDAKNYCYGMGVRLPAWIEWEKAARGDDGRKYPWGDAEPTCELLNYQQYFGNEVYEFCVGDTVAVGSYPDGQSPYFAYDMSGNVAEWVSYVCDEYPEADQSVCQLDTENRPTRGAAWSFPPGNVDSRHEWQEKIDDSNAFTGFRCMREY